MKISDQLAGAIQPFISPGVRTFGDAIKCVEDIEKMIDKSFKPVMELCKMLDDIGVVSEKSMPSHHKFNQIVQKARFVMFHIDDQSVKTIY